MRKLVKRNLRDQLVESIGSAIVSGQLQPGDPLPAEDVLLAGYDVSRTVLRDAFNVLSGKGLLDARPRRGTIVRPREDWSQLDPELLSWSSGQEGDNSDSSKPCRLDSLMEVRRIIEPAAAALAAARATPQDIAQLDDAYQRMANSGRDVEIFVEADLAFHIAVLQAAKNDFLLPVAHAIRSTMAQSIRITNQEPEGNKISLPLHLAILDAIRLRDAEAAAMAMDRHLNDTEYRRALAEKPGKLTRHLRLPLQLARKAEPAE